MSDRAPRWVFWLIYGIAITLSLALYWWLATAAFASGRLLAQPCTDVPYAAGERPACVRTAPR